METDFLGKTLFTLVERNFLSSGNYFFLFHASFLQVETVTETSWNIESVHFVNGSSKYVSKKAIPILLKFKNNCQGANLFYTFSDVWVIRYSIAIQIAVVWFTCFFSFFRK